jgi:putative phosphoribosyl transferase
MFRSRADAGGKLARLLQHLRGPDVVVLGLPRGGVPVAFGVAQALEAPLDVIVVRKLGVPYQPELAMGAIGEGDVRIINRNVVAMAGVDQQELDVVERRERVELERRARLFRGGRPRISLEGRTALIVDDGIATGSTVRAAGQVARAQGAARVVVATPVAPPDIFERLQGDVDELIVALQPDSFNAIGEFYLDFSQTSDSEVTDLLHRAGSTARATTPSSVDPPSNYLGRIDREVVVVAGPIRLPGHLMVPAGAAGIVLFAHGSGSSRHSPRNRFVAETLNQAGLGTLLFDLLTPSEELDRTRVFDIELLADRLVQATKWLLTQFETPRVRLGFFGASTGAAAALRSAAELGPDIRAVVSRGGRPDLVGARLAQVQAATLLIVGSHDPQVLELNLEASARLRCEHRVEVVPGASHLFEEPGTLEMVAELARDWFIAHFSGREKG